jgi:hypothetical protein
VAYSSANMLKPVIDFTVRRSCETARQHGSFAIHPAVPPVDRPLKTGMNSSENSEELRIGPDLVRIEAGNLALYSRRDMSDWVVREFCRPDIWFQEQRFYLCARQSVRGPFRWKYTLCPWQVEDLEAVPYSIHYSDLYVQERERQYKSELATGSARHLLLPAYPFLGFLWSGLKDHLESLGFNARSITSTSVMIELGAVLMLGIYIGYLGGWSIINVLMLLTLTADVVFRYDAVLRDKMRQPGLLEWCFRR